MLIPEENKQSFKEYREQQQNGQGLIGSNASHRQVLKFFKKLHAQKWITKHNIKQLLDHRKVAIDIFCLADFENDKILYEENQELDFFWEEMIKFNEESEQYTVANTNLQQAFKNQIENDMLALKQATFHDIQKLLWEYHVNYQLDIEQIQSSFYFRQVHFTRCCIPCKRIRRYLMIQKLNPENPKEIHYGVGKVLSQIFVQLIHILDLLTDCQLAYMLYQLSREDLDRNNQSFNYHYNIGFTMVSIAIFGPYIIQYSTLMNILNIKGQFQKEKFKTLPIFKKIYLSLSFFFVGIAIMPVIDLALKLQILILTILHLIPFIKVPFKSQTPIAEWGQKRLERLFELIFDLNPVELQNFEKQKKYIQVTFEDFIMVLLQILIQFQILNVPKITMYGESKETSIRSAITTSISIISTLIQLYVESKGYQEIPCEYIILSLKAKPDWIPFGNILKNNQIKFNVDFTIIELPLPKITTILGYYQTQEFQFSESNLKQLAAILDVYLTNNQSLFDKTNNQFNQVSQALESQDSNPDSYRNLIERKEVFEQQANQFIPRLKFGFSLMTISAHTFLSFINKTQQRNQTYVNQYLDFNDIDWDQLLVNSRLQKLDLKYGQIDGGKSLLQVCIENEDSVNHRWQLKPLMELLLEMDDGCDPNILDENKEYSMLSFCYNNKKHLAFELLVKTKTQMALDLNKKNPINGSTIYGILFRHGTLIKTTREAYHQSYHPFEKLQLLFQINGGSHGIDIHQNQIEQFNKLQTPILFYLNRIADKKYQTIQAMKQDQLFKDFFGTNDFTLQNELEIQQLLNYTTEKKCVLTESLLKEAQDCHGGSLNYALEKLDENSNNFMHVTGCRVSDKKWPQYLMGGLQALKQIAKKQLKQQNFNEETPIQKMLKDDSDQAIKVKGLQKLFDLDLIDQDTFEGIEQDVINGFFKRAIKHHLKNQGEPFINQKKFYEAFHDQLKAYQTMRDIFTISKQLEIFESYFKFDKIDQIIADTHQFQSPIDDRYSKVNQQTLEKIMRKEVFQKPNEIMPLKDYEFSNKGVLGQTVKQNNDSIMQRRKDRHFVCETILNGIIEIASSLDFFSDLYIVYQLSLTQHTAWFSFALFTLVAPYLTLQQSAISFTVAEMRLKIEQNTYNCSGYVTTLLLILPTFIILLIIFDLVFMLISFLIYIVLFIGLCTKVRRKIYNKYSDIMNKFYLTLFQMTAMDMQDFRNQRTILQLHLESLPQIFFQFYILKKIGDLSNDNNYQANNSNEISKDEFNIQSIVFSLMCAILHVILEFFDLYLKSETSETSFYNYMAASYNARLGWIPQDRDLYETEFTLQNKQLEDIRKTKNYEINYHCKQKFSQNWTESDSEVEEHYEQNEWANEDNIIQQSKIYKQKVIQFDNKDKTFKYFGYSVSFEFSDNTIHSLFQIISNMNKVDYKFKGSLKIIKLSECIQNISLYNIIQLIRLAHNKIKLIFDEDVLGEVMKRDQQFTKYIQDPINHKKESLFHKDEYLLIEMIVLQNAQFLRLMLNNGAKLDIYSLQNINHKGKYTINIKQNSNAFEIAYLLKDRKSLEVLFEKMDKLNPQDINQTIMKHEIIYQQLLGSIKNSEIWNRPLHPFLLLDETRLVPYDLQSSFDYNCKNVIEKIPELIEERWHILYGAYVPDIDFQKQTKLVSMIENIDKWIQCYPQKIAIIQRGQFEEDDQIIELDSQFLSQFALIRRLFHTRSKLDQQRKNFNKNVDVDDYLRKVNCDLNDLLVLYKLYHNQEHVSTIEQVGKCDKIVKSFGFDKNCSQYYHNSRNFISSLAKCEYIEIMEFTNQEILSTKLSQNSLAINELVILTSAKPSSNTTAHSINFTFKMPHYKGKINNIQLPLPRSFSPPPSVDPSQQPRLLAAISFSSLVSAATSSSSSYDHLFIRFYKTLLNSITAGHEITIQVFEGVDNDTRAIECTFRLKLVKGLQAVRNVEVRYEGVGELQVSDER